MRWKNTETPTFAGSAGSGSAPAVAETLEAVDKDGNVVVAITKSVAGAISMEINGEAVPSLDSVSSTELGYLDGVTGAIQTQLDAKLASASVLRSYLATTVTYNANAVLANTPLSVTVAAGGIYAIELVVHSTSAAKALLMDFGGTATIANFIGEWFGRLANDVATSTSLLVTTAGADFNGNALDGSDETFYTFTGSVEITDAGTFLLRGAQNVSDASNTTILRGSTLTLTKLN